MSACLRCNPQAIAELIAPECTSSETAQQIASTILEFERNETA